MSKALAIGLLAIGAGAFYAAKAQAAALAPVPTPVIGPPELDDFTRLLPKLPNLDFGNYPRGVSNNNPFNIKYDPANQWDGQQGSDGVFCVFITPEKGYRAGFKLLMNYYDYYGINNVVNIIERLAPSNENNTEAYIAKVCGDLKLSPFQQLDMHDPTTLMGLAISITDQEQGYAPWGWEIIQGGLNEAFASYSIN